MDRTEAELPELTAVVVVLDGGAALARCLDALSRQTCDATFEVIVPFDETSEDITPLRQRFPHVRFEPVAGGNSFAAMRAQGVHRMRGRIVALTEDHCVPDAGWCAEIVAAHKRPHPAIGGAVDKAGDDTPWNWGLYLCDYLRYKTPLPEGSARSLSDCNVSYKRASLAAISDIWTHEFHENMVHHALRAKGGILWLTPRIVVHERRTLTSRAAVRERYTYGRLFASTRIAGRPRLRRWLYLLVSPLLPLLLLTRVAGEALLKRRLAREFFRALPAVIALTSIWAIGEFVGYLTGRDGRGRVHPRLAGPILPKSQLHSGLSKPDYSGRQRPPD